MYDVEDFEFKLKNAENFEVILKDFNNSHQELLKASRRYTENELMMQDFILSRYSKYYTLFKNLSAEFSMLKLDASKFFIDEIRSFPAGINLNPTNIVRIKSEKVVQFNMGEKVLQIPEKYLEKDGKEKMNEDYERIKKVIAAEIA